MSEEDRSSQPVACTLRPRQLADRGDAWKQLLRGWMVNRQATPEGGQITLLAAPGVASAARELAELEAECCPWMSIRVQEADLVTLLISSAEPGGPETIREMFRIG
jgi:hypothetical protein